VTPAEAADVVRDYKRSRALIAEAVTVLLESGQPLTRIADRAGVTTEGVRRMRARYENGGTDPRRRTQEWPADADS
jgi:hypothetical protein